MTLISCYNEQIFWGRTFELIYVRNYFYSTKPVLSIRFVWWIATIALAEWLGYDCEEPEMPKKTDGCSSS